eukprot:GHVP01010447.1.p1 GENE.GHVP01010447.1~~GHVP01010447.1.p1  ORF type:complete len:128 (+),score=20.06 GHVP01010447.1:34-384(+)
MELLKTISDDVSNTAIGPPTFVQNDDQEAGGLNYQMQSDYTESSAVPQADPRITISFSSDSKKKRGLRYLINGCGEIKRPTGNSASFGFIYYPETKGGCCEARGWTEDGIVLKITQ